MKCCASPTTSTAAERPAPTFAAPIPTQRGAANTAAAGLAANAIQAVLFGEILKPLSSALGPVGDIALAEVTQGLFVPARR